MKVELTNNTPLFVCSDAIRQCWDSGKNSDAYEDCGYDAEGDYYDNGKQAGPKDKDLIDRVGNKNKHASTLEHLFYNFTITGISRAVLQELARHRVASLSVKSSRYTLQELVKEKPFIWYDAGVTFSEEDGMHVEYFPKRVFKYCVKTGHEDTDMASAIALENLRQNLVKTKGKNRDRLKYSMPESYKTDLAWSINARALQNFIALRTNKAALWEIRELAYEVFDQLPQEHKYLFEDFVYDK